MAFSWEEYKRIYWSFELSLLQNEIISFYIGHLLSNFPNKLPAHIKKKFQDSIADWIKVAQIIVEFRDKGGDLEVLRKFAKDLSKDTKKKVARKNSKRIDHRVGISKFFDLSIAAVNSNEKNPMDFPGIFRSQELVMLVAHFEAFLSDSLRSIYLCKPEKLRRNKTIEWKEIIEFDDMDLLREHLTNKAVYEFGWLSLENKFALLKEEHGIQIQLSISDVNFLRESENNRHLVVHSGGRQYIIESETTNNQGREKAIKWTAQNHERLTRIMRKVAKNMYSEMGRKYFNISRKEATLK